MFKEILQSGWFSGLAMVIIGFFLISIIKFEPQLISLNKELKNINQKIEDSKKSILELEKFSDYLKSDAYLERQARLTLNYKKPDEKVVFVYTKPQGTQVITPELKKINTNKMLVNLKMWWEYLINR